MKKIVAIFALVVLATGALHAQDKRQDWANYQRYAEANAQIEGRPLAVLMGDSITDGWDNEQGHPEFFTDNNLINRGISGQVTSQMLCRFRADVLAHNPQYVVILAGANDLAQNNGYIAEEHILENLISMCELARLHRIKPILCSLTPGGYFYWNRSIEQVPQKIMALNAMIKAYAQANRIPYVDYHTALKDEQNSLPLHLAEDSIHPTKECYLLMEQILLPYLK